MWVIRRNRKFYSQGPNPRWYGALELGSHFTDEQAAHDEARVVLGLEPGEYVVDVCYPAEPRHAHLRGAAPAVARRSAGDPAEVVYDQLLARWAQRGPS